MKKVVENYDFSLWFINSYRAIIPDMRYVKYNPNPIKKTVFGANMTYTSDTDFMKLASKTDINDLMAVIDELFSCIQLTAPKLYDSAIYKLKKANL